MKKRSKSIVAEFDFTERRKFVTGASERKELRRKEANVRALEKQKEERRLLRADRREKIKEHIRHVQVSQRLAGISVSRVRDKSFTNTSKRVTTEDITGANTKEIYKETVPPNVKETPKPVQTIHVNPEGASALPWLAGSYVCMSLGGFGDTHPSPGVLTINEAQCSLHKTPLSTAASASGSLYKKSKEGTPSGSKLNKARTRRQACRGGGHKSQKKRHKSRKPQRRRGSRCK